MTLSAQKNALVKIFTSTVGLPSLGDIHTYWVKKTALPKIETALPETKIAQPEIEILSYEQRTNIKQMKD